MTCRSLPANGAGMRARAFAAAARRAITDMACRGTLRLVELMTWRIDRRS